MLRQLVHVEVNEASNQSPSMCDRLSGDCTYGTQKQHSPKNALRLDCVELHDQWKLQELSNKRNDRHLEQRLLGVKVGLHDDREYGQIYVSG